MSNLFYFIFQSEWTKAFHIIFVVCWFSCIFYLPRLFVNYAIANSDDARQQLVVMQRKLFKFSIPFAVLTIITGAGMVTNFPSYYLKSGWFLLKIALVIGLVIYHGICGRMVRQFAEGKNIRSHKFYRVFNELPVFILFAVVILVEVRPF